MPASRPTTSPVPICAPGEWPVAQYDVYANPSRSVADGISFVVVIQSDLLNALATRLTMPLAELDFAGKVPTALCPVITGWSQAPSATLVY